MRFKRMISTILSLALTASFWVLPDGAEAASRMRQKTAVPSELHVEGRYIYNAEGEKVRLTGANIPDLQWATGGDNDLMKRIGILCDQWNANCVRLCVHSKFWFGQEWYQGKNYMDYRKMVDNVINQITSRGKYVILNLHEFYAITEQQKDFWNDAVEVYGNNPGVLFGLLNEPHDINWDLWRNGGMLETSDAYGKKVQRVYGHQEILDMIRNRGAKNIVIAGGLDWAYYFDGLCDGYNGMEHGYKLSDPTGNGVIYDTHIYPMKPEYNPVEKAVECLVNEAPILVGEYGHWGERLFDWYDNYLCDYPHIWMNEIHDFIDRNELNYTAWSFHIGANPNMFMDYDTFTPSNYSGIYMKYKMLSEPETRPAAENRPYEDPTPLYTWKRVIDFDNTAPKSTVYGDEVKSEIRSGGAEDNGLTVSFDRSAAESWDSAAVISYPEETDLSGAEWLSMRIKGDGDMRKIGIGIELKDGRMFTSYMNMDLHDNWKDWFFPLAIFKNEEGLLDTTQIKSVLITSLDDGVGSFMLDNVTIGGKDYNPAKPFTVSESNQKTGLSWVAWEDDENTSTDSFTVTTNSGTRRNPKTTPVMFSYNCPEGSYGGQARATIPVSWNIADADYFTFWAKGDGSKQRFMLRFEQEKGTNQKEQRSKFKKRELERFCIAFDVNSKEWKQYKFRISDLGMSDMMHLYKVRWISLFNLTLESSGTLWIDDFAFTNIGDKSKSHYERHEAVHISEPVGELKTKYPLNVVAQIPKTFEVNAGEEEHISIHLMNKTDRNVAGELKIEGLPIEGVANAKYNTYAGWVSYPHFPWRNYSYSNFAFTIPKDKKGEYEITVSDVSDNGVLPQTYKLIVK
ncbi:MAG: cellulase family glycosylhydrolase [Clostridia bacterium]|nr:cellulase family glycosylhydrolase [Clostridia bacterium]